MKTCSKCKKEIELSKFYNDIRYIDNKYSSCKKCVLISKQKYYKNNKIFIAKREKEWYIKNKQDILEKKKEYNKVNKNKKAIYEKEYTKKNKYKKVKNNAKYRAKKLNATPKWLTKSHFEEIKAIYKKAKEIELKDGIKRHVDHIVPLQGKTVCGLHVPWNLQILTRSENLKKGNNVIK